MKKEIIGAGLLLAGVTAYFGPKVYHSTKEHQKKALRQRNHVYYDVPEANGYDVITSLQRGGLYMGIGDFEGVTPETLNVPVYNHQDDVLPGLYATFFDVPLDTPYAVTFTSNGKQRTISNSPDIINLGHIGAGGKKSLEALANPFSLREIFGETLGKSHPRKNKN